MKPPFRVLVCGGRTFGVNVDGLPFSETVAAKQRQLMRGTLDAALRHDRVAVIIHGAAPGADTLAGDWAVANGVPVEPYPADWTRHGKAAGGIRNRQMLVEGKPDVVVAFAGGRGTENMMIQARKAGVRVVEVKP